MLSIGSFEDDPTLTGDELEIVFQSDRDGTPRLWHSIRTARSDAWPTPTVIAELDAYAPNTPELSRDGLRLRLTSAVDGNEDLYVSTRADRAAAWQTPIRIASLASPERETSSAEFMDGRALVFFSDRPGGDLWESFDDECMGFVTTRPLSGGIIRGEIKANPWMRNDGLVLVYQGMGSAGNGDLLVATRAQAGGAFDAPVELTSISTGATDDDPWLNDAMDAIYFVSAISGDVELYYATR